MDPDRVFRNPRHRCRKINKARRSLSRRRASERAHVASRGLLLGRQPCRYLERILAGSRDKRDADKVGKIPKASGTCHLRNSHPLRPVVPHCPVIAPQCPKELLSVSFVQVIPALRCRVDSVHVTAFLARFGVMFATPLRLTESIVITIQNSRNQPRQ